MSRTPSPETKESAERARILLPIRSRSNSYSRNTTRGIRTQMQRSPAEQYRSRERSRRANHSCVRNVTGDLVQILTGRRCGLGKKTRRKKRKRRNKTRKRRHKTRKRRKKKNQKKRKK